MEHSNQVQRATGKRLSRRKSLALLTGGVAGATLAACSAPPQAPGTPAPGATKAAPAASGQAVINWKLQSTWAASDWTQMCQDYFAERVNKMAGGRMKVDSAPAGTYVPAAEVLDAVHKDIIQGGHAWAGYWVGKHPAIGLFTGTDLFGMDHLDVTVWMLHGDGLKLYNEILQQELKYNVIAFDVIGDVPEPQGWFHKPLTSWADLKGLKFRAAGLSGEIYKEAGATVVTVAGAEVVPAGDKKTIDAAEWSDPTSDMALGLQEIWKYYHMPGAHTTCAWLEMDFNKTRYEQLPEDLREIIDSATRDTALWTWTALWYKNPFDLETLKTKYGVKVVETPPEILENVAKATAKVYEKKAAENATFAKTLANIKQFAERHVQYRAAYQPSYQAMANYYWKK